MSKSLEKYVKDNLDLELKEITNSKRAIYLNELNEFEKALIYHYTDNGYEVLNETLRNGGGISEFGQHLNSALDKLADYKLLCYRTINCTKKQLKKYYDALSTNSTINEASFLSCSKSKMLSLYFSGSPLFIIKSKRGKEIEKIAKFGFDSGQNEKEVLFMSNSKFRVLDIKEEKNMITITLEEI